MFKIHENFLSCNRIYGLGYETQGRKPNSTRKNMKTRIAIASALMAASSIASAGGYFGGSYIMANYENEVVDVEPSGALLRIGADIQPMIAIEGRLAFGLFDDDQYGIDFELDHILGVYVKISPMEVQKFSPYAVFGFAESEMSAGSFSSSESDFSYGFGCDFEISPGLSANVEYASYYDDGDEDLTGISLGVTSRF